VLHAVHGGFACVPSRPFLLEARRMVLNSEAVFGVSHTENCPICRQTITRIVKLYAV